MLISVIIPVYQAKNSLKECVQSITEEYSDEIEIILVDDGSTDGSAEICDTLAKKRNQICVYHQENQGVSAARNRGIKLAKGKYVMFLDADDRFVMESWKTIMNYARQNIDFVAFSYYSWFPNGKLIEEPFPDTSIIRDYDAFMKILLGTPLLHTCWAKLFRKSLIEEKQIFFPVGVPIGEDYVFVMEYCKYIKTQALINCYAIQYYQNPIGAMGNFQLQKQVKCLEYIWNYCRLYTSDEKRKKYYEVMCQYQLFKMFSIIRMLVQNTKGWKRYYDIKEIIQAPIVRKIIQSVPAKQIHGYRKIEYLCIRWKLAFFAYWYFSLKAKLMRIHQ